MTNYVIVQNKQTVLLGPMPWRQRMFQSEINDLHDQGEITVKYEILPVENGYVNLGEGIEIFPVFDTPLPEHDNVYETVAGPFWNFGNNIASPSWNVVPVDINVSKTMLKNLAASERYKKEIKGTKTTVQGKEVTLDTSRNGRLIFSNASNISDVGTTNWKFPEGWLNITKAQLGTIVSVGTAYIQAQFDWEANISSQVDAATNVEELKAIVIVEPSPAGKGSHGPSPVSRPGVV